MVDDQAVQEVKDNDEIGLKGFDLNLFGEDDEGVARKVLSEYPYLLMLMKVWTGNCKNLLEMMNITVDEYNV